MHGVAADLVLICPISMSMSILAGLGVDTKLHRSEAKA